MLGLVAVTSAEKAGRQHERSMSGRPCRQHHLASLQPDTSSEKLDGRIFPELQSMDYGVRMHWS